MVLVIFLSLVCILLNLEVSKNIGVFDDILEIVIFFGINIYKDGLVLVVIIKVVFLLGILGSGMVNLVMIG